MSPIDWATRPLKNYAGFSGRAPRAEFWWFYLLLVVAYLVAMIIDSLVGFTLLGPYGIITALVAIAFLVPYLAVLVRRLHDTERSGWWILLPVVPYAIVGFLSGRMAASPADESAFTMIAIFGLIALVAIIVLIVFLVLPGTKGPNKYGEDPYAAG
jgi:uncharacterized membrane protein YhaH (DUF805 family)